MTPRYQLWQASGEDWFTYQTGAGTISDLDPSGDQTITYQSAYPKQTDLDAIKMEPVGGTSPLNYSPISEPQGTGNFSSHLAIYVQSGSGFAPNNTTGWHVFANANVSFGLRARWRNPVAWPSGSNNDDGKLGVMRSTNQTCVVVTLSQAPTASGSGGTDSWSAPDFI